MKNLALILLLCAAVAPRASAESGQKAPVDPIVPQAPHPTSIPPGAGQKPEEEEWYIRVMLHPIPQGMSLYLPVIDTDPNRGITYGVMPIWVMKGKGEDRIVQIHAPSLTHNPIFRWTPTYRFYYYPKPDSSVEFRASASQVTDREIYGHYEDFNLLNENLRADLEVQYNVDGSSRFFGLGPATTVNNQANYARYTLGEQAVFGAALYSGSRWHANISQRIEGDKIANGPIETLSKITDLYPEHAPVHFHQNSSVRAFINYDNRDNPVATTEGSFAEFYWETAQRAFGGEYVYHRYGADLRYFYKHPSNDRFVTAGQVKFEQVLGSSPFWLLPQMGGKYVLRAYGKGRFVDKELLAANLEERYTFFQKTIAGVPTEFEVAPFAGLGAVSDAPEDMKGRYTRPVCGAAVRAVAPPQVVGSIDFGVGQEGSAVFMDINYSF